MSDDSRLPPVLIVLTLALAGGGCSVPANTEGGGNEARLIAEVDRLDVLDRIAPSDTLSVRLHGTVGPNGCYSFDRFDVERTADRLTVTPVVQRRGGDDVMCTMALVPLDETYAAAPPFSEGPLTVAVPQTGRPAVTTTVEVTNDAD